MSISILGCAALMMHSLAATNPASTGTLRVTVHEEGSSSPLPCRAWVKVGEDYHFMPQEDESTPYKKDQSFSCMGRFTMKIPVGPAIVHVERGKEYVPVDLPVEIQAGKARDLKIALRRWIDMPAQGWYSAELHNHFGHDRIKVLKQLALADDIHWLPSFTYWNDFQEKWPDYARTPIHPADDRHIVSLHNMEIERIGGDPFHSVDALFLFGINKPVHVPRHDHFFPPSATLAALAKQHSPDCVIDTDKPLWAENVVTMAFGHFDSVQVCHNHYHRRQTIHECKPCCGMIDDSIEEEARDWGGNELFHRTNVIYYRWLNCGFRLAVSGGSAMGVMAVPPGYNRTYAKIEGKFSEPAYRRAIREGRTFATSGPMIWLHVDGRMPGDTIHRSGRDTDKLNIQAKVQGLDRLDSLEILMGGKVVQEIDLQGKKTESTLEDITIVPERSTWIAARAIFTAPDGYLRQAHTSPVYVILDEKPIASRRDAEYMIRWIDRLLEAGASPERYARPGDRMQALHLYRQARAFYTDIARMAERHWKD